MLNIQKGSNSLWTVSTSKDTYSFDYVVVCTGMYHLAQTPKFVSDFVESQ